MIDTTFDVQALAAHVARLQHEHASRSEADAAMRSAAAIRDWGERLPHALADVIRTPAPTGFSQLFHDTTAAISAGQE